MSPYRHQVGQGSTAGLQDSPAAWLRALHEVPDAPLAEPGFLVFVVLVFEALNLLCRRVFTLTLYQFKG